MNRHLWIFTLVAFLLVASIAAFPANIVTDYDHKIDFSKYKTYSWAKVEMPDPLWNDRVKDAVDKELSSKGWTKVPDGGDVSLVALGTTKEKTTLRTFYDGFDGWRWGGFGDAITTEDHYTVGTLIIDMFDTNSKHLIWRGRASDVLAEKPTKDEKKLEKTVHKMFEHFPPKTEEKK
jgi:hypothetical protein